MRERYEGRYEDWLDDQFGVLRHSREMDREKAAAEAKRERKAAKRRRDAELTRLGRAESRMWWEAFASRDDAKAIEAGDIRAQMRAIRRDEVQP